jgi:hypothetical protein
MGKNHTNPDTFPRLADRLTTVAPRELSGGVRHHRACATRARRPPRPRTRPAQVPDPRVGDQAVRGRGRPTPGTPAASAGAGRLRRRRRPPRLPPPRRGAVVPRRQGRERPHRPTGPSFRCGQGCERSWSASRLGCASSPERTSCSPTWPDRGRPTVEALLRDHGVLAAEQWVPIKRNSFACPACPPAAWRSPSPSGPCPACSTSWKPSSARWGSAGSTPTSG